MYCWTINRLQCTARAWTQGSPRKRAIRGCLPAAISPRRSVWKSVPSTQRILQFHQGDSMDIQAPRNTRLGHTVGKGLPRQFNRSDRQAKTPAEENFCNSGPIDDQSLLPLCHSFSRVRRKSHRPCHVSRASDSFECGSRISRRKLRSSGGGFVSPWGRSQKYPLSCFSVTRSHAQFLLFLFAVFLCKYHRPGLWTRHSETKEVDAFRGRRFTIPEILVREARPTGRPWLPAKAWSDHTIPHSGRSWKLV